MLKSFLEAVASVELERRREELDEALAALPGGFATWQEVASTNELRAGADAAAVVAAFAPGIVVGSFVEGRVTVKFDERLDGSAHCVNVLPHEIVPEVPRRMGFRVGQKVAAVMDLMSGITKIVHFGTRGLVCKKADTEEDRLTVQFESRADGLRTPVNVQVHEIAPSVFLGGLAVGDRVTASRDLVSGTGLLVREGMRGVVRGPYSDARLIVRFDERVDGQTHAINVLPCEIRRQ